jgi:hypothetical protein
MMMTTLRMGWMPAVLLAVWIAPAQADLNEDILAARTFHASFDKGTDADSAKGDGKVYTVVEKKGKEGIHTDGATTHLTSGGLADSGAMKFTKGKAPWIYYKGAKNVSYTKENWKGSVAFWLKLDPDEDLEPGYCDPIQITTRAWNDGSFFVDFAKDGNPRDFRLGAFADLLVWNPDKAEVPEEKRPLLPVRKPPFGRNMWTHVAFTWDKFNTGKEDGVAQFYLNGHLQGSISGWNQQFTWKDEEEIRLYLGLHYTGLFDELSCYNRALSGEEMAHLYQTHEKLRPAKVTGLGQGWRALGGEDFVNVNCEPDTWKWTDGLAECTGNPVGVIRMKEPVKNCELVAEWRHLKSAGNSGIFLWATDASIKQLEAGKGRLPHGIEVQVLDLGYTEAYIRDHKKPADWFTCHGDVFPVGPVKMTPFPPVAPNGKRSFPSKNLTKGVGEWNHYYVRAINGEVRLWVNGEEVSGGSGCDPSSGYLCLESEGSPIEFRNLRIRELP